MTPADEPSSVPTSAPAASPLGPAEFWHLYFQSRHASALKEEVDMGEDAFIDATITVAGFELRPMTCYDYNLLGGSGNPFLAGGVVEPEHILQFLAVLTVPAPVGFWRRRAFLRRARALPYAHAVSEIRAYVRRMFLHSGVTAKGAAAPSAIGEESSTAPQLSICALAGLITGVAAETGWSEHEILSMRLDRLFQYRAAIDMRRNGELRLAQADRVVAEFLAAYNHYTATGQVPA